MRHSVKVGSHRLLRAHGLGGWEESGPGLLAHLPVKVTRPTSGVTWLRGAAVPAVGESGCGHHRDSPDTGRRPPAATVCTDVRTGPRWPGRPGLPRCRPIVATVTTTNRLTGHHWQITTSLPA